MLKQNLVSINIFSCRLNISVKTDFITSTFIGAFPSSSGLVASFTLFLPVFLLEIMTKTLSYVSEIIQMSCKAKKEVTGHEIGQ